ncbi:hypothetical protein MKX53_19440 [Psychrobacillus sp. FSL K6-4615]|uniref:hypothetical protein n=1 Tax=Psychrobacillus TaxID=1221880 RepID=UPI0030F5055D
MDRKHSNYEVQIIGKPLRCPHCGGAIFSHREVYLDIVPPNVDVDPFNEDPPEQLVLQSFTCNDCYNIQQFQQLTKGMETNIVCKQVD